MPKFYCKYCDFRSNREFRLNNHVKEIHVKKLLKYNNSELDDVNNKTINVKNLKTKINKISELTKSLKNNG